MAPPPSTLEEAHKQIEELHKTFETLAVNSRGTGDVFGRVFTLPVDKEHKGKIFNMQTIFRGTQQPHLRAFWASTFGFFSCFFSVFAPAALIPYMTRPIEEGGIGLQRQTVVDSGAAAVASTILMRILCGPMCDKFGVRYTFIILLLLAVPGIVGLMFIQGGTALILCRLCIGLGLASFVTCQVWMSMMFSKSVVGIANATAGGWGNLGGGVTQLVMPQVMVAMLGATGNNVNLSWRLCFILPLAMHLIAAVLVFTGRDLPDGNYKELERQGSKQKGNGLLVAKIGLSNVNAWLLALGYGLCFGVELCMNNKAVPYFHRYYGLNVQTSGTFAACFGLMNLFARSWGGLLSDAMNKKFGIRGRIWSMWIVQTCQGVMCVLLGLITIGYPNPDEFTDQKVVGTWTVTEYRQSVTYSFNTSIGMVPKCGSKEVATPAFGIIGFGTESAVEHAVMTDDAFIMIRDPNNECLHAQAPLGLTMVCMIGFSILVQMAEGLHFGIVPYVSRPALGVVSGMVGAGGNLGGFISSKYIVNAQIPLDDGFINLGIVIIAFSLSMFAIYLPEHGGMLFRAGGLGKYNPQLIKPPADLRGSDQLEYDTNNETGPDGHHKVMPSGKISGQVAQVPTSATAVTDF